MRSMVFIAAMLFSVPSAHAYSVMHAPPSMPFLPFSGYHHQGQPTWQHSQHIGYRHNFREQPPIQSTQFRSATGMYRWYQGCWWRLGDPYAYQGCQNSSFDDGAHVHHFDSGIGQEFADIRGLVAAISGFSGQELDQLLIALEERFGRLNPRINPERLSAMIDAILLEDVRFSRSPRPLDPREEVIRRNGLFPEDVLSNPVTSGCSSIRDQRPGKIFGPVPCTSYPDVFGGVRNW